MRHVASQRGMAGDGLVERADSRGFECGTLALEEGEAVTRLPYPFSVTP